MPLTPINREDGRHWCNPASASPEDSPIICPDCGKMWEFDDSTGVPLWSQVEDNTQDFDVPFDDLIVESPGD